jgi:glycosyltransferase involved in cell wall biosynthesis
MSNKPTISIIIPAYNAERWISETLQSILAQSFVDYEVIVVDDGSTDNTVSVATGFGEHVKCICRPHSGKSQSRNTGIVASRGDYVAFVDADDLWLPKKLKLQMQLLNQTSNLKWVYTDGYIFQGDIKNILATFGSITKLYSGDILCPLFLHDFIPSPSPLIRREILFEVGLFDDTLARHEPEDWDMWLRIAERYPVGLVNIPLVYYRRHPNSLTMREDHLIALKGQLAIVERAITRNPERLRPYDDRAKAKCYVLAGQAFANDGNSAEARKMFNNAIRLAPKNKDAYLYWLSCLAGPAALRFCIRLRRWLRIFQFKRYYTSFRQHIFSL